MVKYNRNNCQEYVDKYVNIIYKSKIRQNNSFHGTVVSTTLNRLVLNQNDSNEELFIKYDDIIEINVC